MPRIVLKRSDISAGTLQVEDLKPNESQRNPPYQPVGQSVYGQQPDTGSVVLTGAGPITVVNEVTGLQAYLIANVPSDTQAASTGFVTVASFVDVTVGDTITIGGVTLTGVSGPRTSGSDDFSIDDDGGGGGTISDADTLVAELVRAINDPANSFTTIVTAAEDLPNDQVDLTAVAAGDAGDSVTLATNDGTAFTLSGGNLTGGTDAPAMTASDADTIVQDILDNVLAYDDTSSAAVAADASALDSEIQTTVANAPGLTAQQVEDILDILAGRVYRLPAGTQVEDAGNNLSLVAPAGETVGFVEGTLRNVYETGTFRVSAQGGRLAGYLRNDFNFGTATGSNLEAIILYNDDGTLYTP